MATKIRTILTRLRSCTSGNALVMVGLGLPILVGAAGLGVDVSQWYLWRRELQFAVDQAAIAGAWALTEPESAGSFAARAKEDYHGNLQVTSAFAGDPVVRLADYGAAAKNSVVVSATAKKALPFTSMLMNLSATIGVSAKAAYELAGNYNPCLIALDPSASNAVYLNGDVTVRASCGIGALSKDKTAIRKDGAAGQVDVGFVVTAGGIVDEFGHFADEAKITSALGMTDPYASVSAPDNPVPAALPTECIGGAKGAITATPGTYSSFNIPCNTVLLPGIYVLNGGSLVVDGTKQLSGSAVMFVLKNGAGIRIDGNARVTLTAMTVDQMVEAGISSRDAQKMPGMLIMEDRSSSGAQGNSLTGSTNAIFNGVIYLPRSPLTIAGSPRGASECMVIASKTLVFSGSVDVTSLCPPGLTPRASALSSSARVWLVR